jgi:hypothetical protein
MNKNQIALTPPMGWNSWDCYGAAVTEEQLLGNAQYMATHLKEYGWEYVVCDIQWYEPKAKSTFYNPFTELMMDEYSRLIPAPNRFPSAANGAGFKPIADQIHDLGLKFGIHIMRGIPRQAVHQNTPLKGTSQTAREIAHSFSVCSWNTDMYGVNPKAPGAQAYYDSLFELYASWGVDYVKVDDICVTEFSPHNPYSAKEEIEMIRKAIDKCNRPMVLSLSPGPAPLSEAEHLSLHANLWRMTGDFWDVWEKLYAMFERCHQWSPYVKPGCWPDCDMLPIGRISINAPDHGGQDRYTQFTQDEQITLMTLWCMFRSPLMIGAEMRDNDAFTLSLLTNEEVLALLSNTHGARQVLRTEDTIVWHSKDNHAGDYVALFNVSDSAKELTISLEDLGLEGSFIARDLWEKQDLDAPIKNNLSAKVNPHGAKVFKLTQIE